jgi:hypothetical protein
MTRQYFRNDSRDRPSKDEGWWNMRPAFSQTESLTRWAEAQGSKERKMADVREDPFPDEKARRCKQRNRCDLASKRMTCELQRNTNTFMRELSSPICILWQQYHEYEWKNCTRHTEAKWLRIQRIANQNRTSITG